MTPLLVDEKDCRGAIRALTPAWIALGQAVSKGAPFHHPDWAAIWAAALARPPRALRLLAAHEGGELVGIAPLLVERRLLSGAPARVLRSLSDDHSQRWDLLAKDSRAVAALWGHLCATPGWDVLELRDVPDEDDRGAGAASLQALAATDGWLTACWPSQRSPYLRLPPSAADLDRLLDGKFRSNLRRRRRLLAAEGALRLERVADVEGGLDEALAAGLALERRGWKGGGGTAIACDETLTTRYRALARAFARRGELSLHFLTVGGQRVAFHLALETGGVYHLLKIGHDERYARFGLGHLLLWEVARSLTERGLKELDFLGGEAEWKREWTTSVRPHTWRYVFRPTPLGRALHAWKTRGAPALRRLVTRLHRGR